MTCIIGMVVNDVVYLAGDSAAVDDNHQLDIVTTTKVLFNGPLMIGWCGSYRMANLVHHSLRVPRQRFGESVDKFITKRVASAIRTTMIDGGIVNDENGGELPGGMILGYKGHIYRLGEEFSVVESTRGFDSVGAGCHFALGAISMVWPITKNVEARMTEIMRVVSKLCFSVAPPFRIIRSDSQEVQTYV